MLKIELLTGRKYLYRDLEIKPLLIQALRANDAMQDIFVIERTIKDGYGFIWVIQDDDEVLGILYGSTILDDRGKALLIELAACRISNRLDVISQAMERVEQFAIDNGYNKVNIYGRVGWKKFLGKSGYRVKAIELEKQL